MLHLREVTIAGQYLLYVLCAARALLRLRPWQKLVISLQKQ